MTAATDPLQALRDTQARLHATVTAAPEAIITIDAQGIIESANPATERVFGYPLVELVGQNVSLLMPAHQVAHHTAALASYSTTAPLPPQGRVHPVQGRRKDGSLIDMELVLSEIQVSNRQLFTGFFRDMTECQRAERAANEREQLLRLLLETTGVALFLCDGGLRFARVNPAFCRLTGYTATELLGQELLLIFPETWQTEALRAWKGFLETGTPMIPEWQLRAKTGDLRDVAVTCGKMVLETGPRYVVTSVADLTAQNKTMEELRKAKDAAEAATHAKSEFLANMSHEIRTPMTVILGHLETIADAAAPAANRQQAIESIYRNGRHLLALIDEVLDLSKIEAGRLDLERIPFSLLEMLREVLALTEAPTNSRGLQFHFVQVGELPEIIISDPTRIKQVLLNLTGNAVKFTDKGSITLEAAREAPSRPGYCRLRLAVRDTGIGLNPTEVNRIFRPFTQANQSTTRQFGGSGLGLTISRHLAQRLGGNLLVESTPGVGSTFTLVLNVPVGENRGVFRATDVKGGEARFPSSDTFRDMLEGYRVLLVEDQAEIQAVVAHLLRKAGAEVTTAAHGRDGATYALTALETGCPFDVILLDMQMPVMDGYEAVALLRQRGYTGPVIALTAHVMKSELDRCRHAGCDECLRKPVEPIRLFETIRQFARPQPSALEERATACAAGSLPPGDSVGLPATSTAVPPPAPAPSAEPLPSHPLSTPAVFAAVPPLVAAPADEAAELPVVGGTTLGTGASSSSIAGTVVLPFDLAWLQARCGEDSFLLRELLERFAQFVNDSVEKMSDDLKIGRFSRVLPTAIALSQRATKYRAHRLEQLAQQMRERLQSGHPESAVEISLLLHQEALRLRRALDYVLEDKK